jgi:hypothetical protein
MVERERLEDDGIGDELMEMQEILWPIKRLRAKDFAIDMLFEYEDDDGSTLVWCQGRVVAFTKESIDKHVYVKIEWSDRERWRPEDYEKSTEKDEMESNCPSWWGLVRGLIP